MENCKMNLEYFWAKVLERLERIDELPEGKRLWELLKYKFLFE